MPGQTNAAAPQPITSTHAEADRAIKHMREAAGTMKKLGDEMVALRDEHEGLVEQLLELEASRERLRSEVAALSEVKSNLERARDLLADYDRGLFTMDEARAMLKPIFASASDD